MTHSEIKTKQVINTLVQINNISTRHSLKLKQNTLVQIQQYSHEAHSQIKTKH